MHACCNDLVAFKSDSYRSPLMVQVLRDDLEKEIKEESPEALEVLKHVEIKNEECIDNPLSVPVVTNAESNALVSANSISNCDEIVNENGICISLSDNVLPSADELINRDMLSLSSSLLTTGNDLVNEIEMCISLSDNDLPSTDDPINVEVKNEEHTPNILSLSVVNNAESVCVVSASSSSNCLENMNQVEMSISFPDSDLPSNVKSLNSEKMDNVLVNAASCKENIQDSDILISDIHAESLDNELAAINGETLSFPNATDDGKSDILNQSFKNESIRYKLSKCIKSALDELKVSQNLISSDTESVSFPDRICSDNKSCEKLKEPLVKLVDQMLDAHEVKHVEDKADKNYDSVFSKRDENSELRVMYPEQLSVGDRNDDAKDDKMNEFSSLSSSNNVKRIGSNEVHKISYCKNSQTKFQPDGALNEIQSNESNSVFSFECYGTSFSQADQIQKPNMHQFTENSSISEFPFDKHEIPNNKININGKVTKSNTQLLVNTSTFPEVTVSTEFVPEATTSNACVTYTNSHLKHNKNARNFNSISKNNKTFSVGNSSSNNMQGSRFDKASSNNASSSSVKRKLPINNVGKNAKKCVSSKFDTSFKAISQPMQTGSTPNKIPNYYEYSVSDDSDIEIVNVIEPSEVKVVFQTNEEIIID